MAVLIDGKLVSAKVREKIAEEGRCLLQETGVQPGLAVIIVGEDPASQVYVRNKKKACEQVGFYSEEYALPAETTQQDLDALLEKLNRDDKIHGILVQLPLPRHLDEKAVIEK
ncbi:MAG: bifunctional 5,10-methylene-tetrahydrofolate dehydrogenase/5,10-methylene-tetrahydrofolate cyclohydrolase, partial [Oscillospiraceae bacterium]|nr:bifunctional 5,10-methylene-tetrahydrofolate dehydrogenase/5,10-methylene-tetrahydrofolate cyclohydrolase [Oscillospiraceae bacterium]